MLKNRISSILPDSPSDYTPYVDETAKRDEIIQAQADKEVERKSAAELARLKVAAKAQVANAQKKAASTSSIPTKPSEAKLKEAQEALDIIETLEAQAQRASATRIDVVAKNAVASGQTVKPVDLNNALKLQGTSRKEITALMTSLGINTSVQLTKADTQNIVACLLTCNETQLHALMSNKKVPIAAKVIIKRLLDDAKVGNIDTVERLWDRIFGKQGLVQALPEQQAQQMQGLIPNVPVSREAYILIRDTLIQ